MDRIVLSQPGPVLPPSTPEAADPQRGWDERPARKPLVVLIDPHPPHVEALQAVLGSHHRLRVHGSAEQAWASLQVDGEADAVIASLEQPRMSGLELVARLRKARSPSLRRIPIVLVANSIDDGLRSRIAREAVDFVAAWDRPLVDLGAWLRGVLAVSPGGALDAAHRSPAKAVAGFQASHAGNDGLRRWAHQHRALDDRMRESLVILRVASDGVGVIGERLARSIRRPEMMLAQSINCAWLCVDVPISAAARFAVRLALSALPDPALAQGAAGGERGDRDRVRLVVSYAPLLQLADETYDVLQTLAGAEPPAGHLQLATHHWRFAMPFDAARLMVR